MERAGTGRPGPNPLLYVFFIILFPVWFFFFFYFNNENTLFYAISVVFLSVVKGALFCEWIHRRFPSFLYWAVGGILVIILEIGVVHEVLQISVVILVALVPLSTGSVIYILHHRIQREKSSSSQVIGIFSRNWKDQFNWLMEPLSKVGEVRPFCISNSNFPDFETLVSQCTFAILYHSKTRGRVNISDVKDSLYDEELMHMSKVLGREKVLVVIDDLEDSSYEMKNRILLSQPTIHKMSRDLLLFTKEQKQDKQGVTAKLQPVIQSLNRRSVIPRLRDVVIVLIVALHWIYCSCYSDSEILLLSSSVIGSLVLYNLLSSSSMFRIIPIAVVLELVYWYYSSPQVLHETPAADSETFNASIVEKTSV